MQVAVDSLGLDLESLLNQREDQYNVAPTQRAPVVYKVDEDTQLAAFRWGLVPAWAKDAKIGARAINARVETVVEKPMFRAAFKQRRCLVPASGYFEWREEEGGKQPYFIHQPEGELLMFAGLWEAWKPADDADRLHTFTIITGKPGKVSGNIHDRQPIILPPKCWGEWLADGPDVATHLLDGLLEAELTYFQVTKAVGSPRNKGPELVQPITS